jgi:peptidyl-prolyl cis-trans isomerase D
MFAFFRRLSKSTVGSIIMVLFVVAIVASFALGDMANIGGGQLTGGGPSLAEIGGKQVTDRDMSQTMERRLTQVRQENPQADYAAIAKDFDPLLASLIDERALEAFAAKFGFVLSKRLVDAEIANIPGTQGLDGRFSEQAYAEFLSQQRLTDQEVRRLLTSDTIQRILLAPVATAPRLPVGVATPYASMLLEARQGEVAIVPIAAFRAGLAPSDADLLSFYAANRSRYVVPEKRVLRFARIGSEQVAGVAATDAEILAYYNANQATYGAKDVRVISQAVVPDRNAANAIAARARRGAGFAAAAAPAGFSAGDVNLGPQTRAEFAGLAGDAVAAAAFAAQPGAVVGPVQSDLGWHVVKIDTVRREGGKSLAAVRADIAGRLTDEKRKGALADLVARVEDALAEGSNFAEAAALGKLTVGETPPITASGAASGNPLFRLPPELAPALKTGFELTADDEPVVETLPNSSGYVLVAPARIIAAAPAPLSAIRARVAEDWIAGQASDRAKAIAGAIALKASRGVPLAKAVAEAGKLLPPVRQVGARRIEISQMGAEVPAPLRMLFTLGPGKSRMLADPQQRGFSIVKVNKIMPGNALSQPGLIGRVQSEFREAVGNEYASQFLTAIRQAVGARRNEKAIAAAKKRISGS